MPIDPELVIPELDAIQVLTWTAWFIRDVAAMWALGAAGTSLLVAVVSLLVRRRVVVDDRAAESGFLAWVFTALACLAPVDRAMFFSRGLAIILLVLSGLGWTMVVLMRRSQKRPRHPR